MEHLPRLAVATRWFGVRSQVWLWRQVRTFRAFSPSVITWRREHEHDYPLGGIPLNLIPTAEEPNQGRGRWLHRLANLRKANAYGSRGSELRLLEKLLREQQANAVLCHFGHIALRFLPVAQTLNIPLIAHFHGDDISSALRDRYYSWSLRRNLRHFSAIVCVGSKQRDVLLSLGAEAHQVATIPCGVPTAEFEFLERPLRPITFLCVCRLVSWKGVDVVIDAFSKVSRMLSGARLVIVGDGKEEANLGSLAEVRGVHENVVFQGAQTPAQVLKLMHACDVFIQHSLTSKAGWFEGFGVSVAEAASTGLPVIVSNCGGLTDQVVHDQTGFIVSEGDVAGLSTAMVALGRDRHLRERLGRAGADRMRAYFDSVAQVRKLESLIDTAIKIVHHDRSRAPQRSSPDLIGSS